MTTKATRAGDCWPSAEQTLLVQAALLDGDAGRRALSAWRSQAALDRLDLGSRRLLPLLYERLQADPADPLLPILRDAHQQAATKNAALIEATAAAIQTLTDAGIDTIVLKGMALIASGMASPGARPMADCDLLVPESLALAARDALLRAGWRLEGRMNADILSLRHAVTFRAPSGHQLDLHWHVLADCCDSGADEDFWRAAVPASLHGVPTRTLCPADMVLHACVHGVRWSIVPPVRWAVDAMTVIRAATAPIDWDRFVVQAETRLLVLPAIDTLRYLRDHLGAPVPGWVDERLARASMPAWARAEYRVKRQPRTARRQAAFHWYHHRRSRASGTFLGDLATFPSYLRRRWRFRAFASS